MGHRSNRSLVVLLCAALVAALSCAEEEYPAGLWAEQHPAPVEGGGVVSPDPIQCKQARATAIPARLVAISASAAAGAAADNVVTEDQIYTDFQANCGSCHNGGQGGFTTPLEQNFASQAQARGLVDHVTGAVCPQTENPNNPADPMPPCNGNEGSYSSRLHTDPVWQFGQLLSEWANAGYPPAFNPSAAAAAGVDAESSGGGAGSDGGAASGYTMTPEIGDALTEIGNCIPARLASVPTPRAAALDQLFASLAPDPSAAIGAAQIGLPLTLSQTDLFTFDSAVLAQYGVVAYAPAYPLWSDNAYKLRHVRVPYGTSIHFNKATQQFEIPPNTRFYKTFTRQIVDTDGSIRYRKIETRLIVARPDINNPDGTAEAQTALFGSYQWNSSETEATLVQTALNDEQPFADTLFTYNTDEQLAAAIQAAPLPAGMTLDQALLAPPLPFPQTPAVRHYAIPSSPRCIQCHMGSPGQVFNLGFTPLQINYRPTGTGGVIEAAGADELTQLQRFIDYGLITGIGSLTDVLPLEDSQGSRKPRNEQELIAQGYVMGNCQHCHNPRGFPSVQAAQSGNDLGKVFNFLPSATGGGLFQFPLERYSPAIFRGLSGVELIPFITPSLVDLPRLNSDPSAGPVGSQAADIFVSGTAVTKDETPIPGVVLYAPWRSIIYRNVDAAFTYVDDLSIFPHMPFNTPGYDPRAKQILGDWMVSIPAVRKHPEIPEYAYQVDIYPSDNIGGPVVDQTPQPYVEVPPGAPGYEAAFEAAQERLQIFHTGINPALPVQMISDGDGGIGPKYPYYSRYTDPGETNDIIDPAVTLNPICHPVPTSPEVSPNGAPVVAPSAPYPFPDHPSWVITDQTLPPPPWQPRGSSWPTVLVEQVIIPPNNTSCNGVPISTAESQALVDETDAVGLLQTTHLSDVIGADGKGFAATPIPFGLFQPPPGQTCSYPPSVPLAGSQDGGAAAPRPHWMQIASPPIPASAPVYMETPGAAVFKMICINCHGPYADANGRLAANLATMTGGLAQVANFKDGLFGPVSAPESNINAVFGSSPGGPLQDIYMAAPGDAGFPLGLPTAETDWTGTTSSPVTPDDRAARYMPWMALGGTSVHIPVQLLQIVAVTEVLGQQRVLQPGQLSANMLSQAKALCLSLLGPQKGANYYSIWNLGQGYLDQKNGTSSIDPSLLLQNGDAELWLRLCAIANPPPIHVLRMGVQSDALALTVTAGFDGPNLQFDTQPYSFGAASALVDSSLYPPNAPVGNDQGGLDPCLVLPTADGVGSSPACATASNTGNLWPWCVDPTWNVIGEPNPTIPSELVPYECPPEVYKASQNCGQTPPIQPDGTTCFGNDRANRWAVRGAINAGMSVFHYVQSIETSGPASDYNVCPTAGWEPK